MFVSDAVEVEAESPEQAITILTKAGVQTKGEFAHTVIEEIVAAPSGGYRQETTADILGAVKADVAADGLKG